MAAQDEIEITQLLDEIKTRLDRIEKQNLLLIAHVTGLDADVLDVEGLLEQIEKARREDPIRTSPQEG